VAYASAVDRAKRQSSSNPRYLRTDQGSLDSIAQSGQIKSSTTSGEVGPSQGSRHSPAQETVRGGAESSTAVTLACTSPPMGRVVYGKYIGVLLSSTWHWLCQRFQQMLQYMHDKLKGESKQYEKIDMVRLVLLLVHVSFPVSPTGAATWL